MTTGSETTTHEAGAHAEEFNAGDEILHHILDSRYVVGGQLEGANEIHIPSPPDKHWAIPLQWSDDWGFHLGDTFISLSITKHVVMMWLAFALLLLMFGVARRQRGLVPTGLRNALEAVVVYIRDEVARRAIHGTDADRYVPFLLTTFFFILTCNLIGLVPGMSTATGNISVTAGLAFISFVIIQWGGIAKYGPVTHVKNLIPHGIPLWMMPLMFVLEVMSQFIRPFALCIRLFANMMAGHVVILAFICLVFILKAVWLAVAPVSVAFVFFVNLLELLVAFLQAYIFTMLTAQFIGISLHPAH